MVREGRISVNGKVATELPILIDPEKDKVTVDDERVKLAGKEAGQRYYVLMNKPKDVFSTNVAQGTQKRAIDLLPDDFPARVYPVGRLDAESTGLLLLTNDGELTNQLTHPRYGVPKTYRAIVEGSVNEKTLKVLEDGVWLADVRGGGGFKATAGRIRIVRHVHDKTILEVQIREGRNRQVRRMLAKVGHKVRDLTRIRMGPLSLEGLPVGKFRPLTSSEVKQLRELATRNKDVKPKPGAGPERRGLRKGAAPAGRFPAGRRPAAGRTAAPVRRARPSRDLAEE